MNLDAARDAYEAAMLAGVMLLAQDGADDVQAILDDQVDDAAYPSMGHFVRRVPILLQERNNRSWMKWRKNWAKIPSISDWNC